MKLALCMPVFNEEEGILDYLREIDKEFSDLDVHIVITEDCSSDNTLSVLQDYSRSKPHVMIVKHETNQGHGVSVRDAISVALELESLTILTFDGDGQVSARELRSFYNDFMTAKYVYGEGCRSNRKDPWFRKLISVSTRFLVLFASGYRPEDGNTPVRIYSFEAAKTLWEPLIKQKIRVPNLYVSSFARLLGFPIFLKPIVWRDRLGESVVGAGWGKQKFKMLPSRGLITFCRDSLTQWFSQSPRRLLKHL